MAKYATRTCSECGIRKPQPEMVQQEIYKEYAKSKKSVSGSTVLGSFMGEKKSRNAMRDWMWNSKQRTYYRKSKVWLCESCAKTANTSNPNERLSIMGCLTIVFLSVVIITIIAIVLENAS